MPRVQQPGLKPTHKLAQDYYAALARFDQHRLTLETAAGQRGRPLETAQYDDCSDLDHSKNRVVYDFSSKPPSTNEWE